MPTVVGHALLGGAGGWALPRKLIPSSALWLGALCSAVPDLDSVGFWLGVPYGSWLGHRGFSHSLAFAGLIALAISLASKALPSYQASRWALFAFLGLCTACHGLLDAMTNGGLGVAFFSPFSNHRYFLPWRPLAVSPLHPAHLLSPWGLRVFLSEGLCIGMPVAFILLTRLGINYAQGKASKAHA